MKKIFVIMLVCLGLALAGAAPALADMAYKVNKEHQGGDVTPPQALEMVMKDKDHTFIVDVRTRPEYDFVGHPSMAYNVPVRVWTGKMVEKKGKLSYALAVNPNFAKDLAARFDPETDTLIFMCRSGGRSCDAANLAAKGGFKADKLFNLMGGFEGDKVKNKASSFNGKRAVNGWKNEGLPWTYHLDPKLVYQADLPK